MQNPLAGGADSLLRDKSQDAQAIRQQQQQIGAVAKVLITFSLLLIILPIALYFITKSLLFEGILSMSPRQSYIYSAIVAVVTVHIILAGFVFFAFWEGGTDKEAPETAAKQD